MPSREYTFGGQHIIVMVEGAVASTARMAVVVNGGADVQPVADAAGNDVELVATGQDAAFVRAASYLARRFGNAGPAPVPTRPNQARNLIAPLIDNRPAQYGLTLQDQQRISATFVALEQAALAQATFDAAQLRQQFADFQNAYRGLSRAYVDAFPRINDNANLQRWLAGIRGYLADEIPGFPIAGDGN